MDEAATKFWTFRRKAWAAGGALGLAALALAGHWLPDFGLRWGLIRSLKDFGWARVSVSDADLSLFNGAIVVRRVEAGEDLGRTLGIDGVDLKFRWKPLFSRRVSVEHLDLHGVSIDIRREDGRLVVNGLPVALQAAGQGGSDWAYDITSLKLTGSRLDFTDGDLKAVVHIERLEIEDLKSWEPDVPARYRLSGRVNNAPVSLEGTATPFASVPAFAARLAVDALDLAAVAELARRAGSDTLSGKVSAQLGLEGSAGTVRAEGRLSLADAAWSAGVTKVAAKSLSAEFPRLVWTGKAEWAGTLAADGLAVEDGALAVSAGRAMLQARSGSFDPKAGLLAWEGSLHAERQGFAAGDIRVSQGELDWTGTARFAPASGLHAEGKADGTTITGTIGFLEVEARRLTVDGTVASAHAEGILPPLAGRMTLAAEHLRVREPGRDWLQADRLEAHDFRLASNAVAVARLEARKLAALAKPKGEGAYPWRLEARQAVVEHAALAGDGALSASSLALTGATARVTRGKAGFLGLPQGGDDGAAPRLTLGKLRVGSGSRLDFEDRALSEPVRLRFDGVEASLAELDSGQPDRASPFSLKARLGAAQISAHGHARPFAAHFGAELKGQVRALELPALSPYAADALGVHLQTGQVDADITMAADKGKLDGAMQLVLSELFVAQPDPNAPLAKKADMPVETVLDLLRDSENRIRLTIPVRGDLANPDFDVSDAVGQAVGGALKSTVFTTLKVAFPLAGLISLVIDDAESRRLALDPLTFPPGAESLGEAERKKLAVLAELMAGHPGMKLTLCGVAQPGEWPELVQRKREEELGLLAKLQKLVGKGAAAAAGPADMGRLAELADARAQAAKAFLVDQAGIAPGRLFTCRPRVEAEPKAPPRVDLVL